MVQGLSRHTYHGTTQSKRAKGALTANLCVAVDTVTDSTGDTVRPVAALADKIAGVVDQSATDGQLVPVYTRNMVVPLVCVDASIATNVAVYNDATGKVSGTQGSGATLIGYTKGKTTAANQLVPVELGAGF